MITFQDLQEVGDTEEKRMDFVRSAITTHCASKDYKTAQIAEDYYKHKNRTINEYQKLLYTVSGKAVPDNWSASYKLASNYFHYFVTQENQYLLGNGVTWEKGAAGKSLGNDFDNQLVKAGKKALVQKCSYGFYNMDHVDVFGFLEFVPIVDEENGALAAGIRFWQIDSVKPLRATFYERDGYTDYIWDDKGGRVLREKRPYKINVSYTDSDGVEIYDGENYEDFPIVPFWGNLEHQSEIVGMREEIDAYDLIKSGFANDLDDVSQIYWTITNAGGMDDIDLAQFVQRMKTVKAASVSDGEQVQAHSIDIPYSARETILDRLRKDMFRDYMALDVEEIAGGAITATQIRAAYEPMNSKADDYEYCVIDFIQGLLKIAGIEDNPTFTRSMMNNQSESITNLIQSAEYLDDEYVTKKILDLFGDGDKAEEMLKKLAEKEIDRGFLNRDENPNNPGEDEQ